MCKSLGKAVGKAVRHVLNPVTNLVLGSGGDVNPYTALTAPTPTSQQQSQTDISDIEAERKRKRRMGFDSTQSPMTILGNFGTSAGDAGKRTLG